MRIAIWKQLMQLEKDWMTDVENNNDIKVITAALSGSRCWGFASDDSDYDVCFIYRHPIDHYLSPFHKKDTITFDKEIDGRRYEFKGWDVSKALLLMHQGNVQPHEWLAYDSMFNRVESDILRELSEKTWNPQVAIRHYLGIAYGNWKKYIASSDTPKTKRYLYVARGIVNAHYVHEYGTLPPAELEKALDKINLDVGFHNAVRRLIHLKRDGLLANGHQIGAIDLYALPVHRSPLVKDLETRKFPNQEVETCFRTIIRHD